MKEKHSELGIASISLSFMAIIYIYIFNLMNVFVFSPRDIFYALPNWFHSLCCLLPLFLVLAALFLGIGGHRQKDRKKLFSILGIIFSTFLLAATCFIWSYISMSGS